MKKTCKNGNHTLIIILSSGHSWDESEKVVRWCSDCGSIVVDLEFDNRTMPGGIMKMRFPKILQSDKL